MKENESENFSRIRKIMLPKDYLAYRLTGVHCTDVSDASGTLFFDVKNRCWSEKMCNVWYDAFDRGNCLCSNHFIN